MRQSHGPVARSLAAGQALRGRKRHPTVEDRVTVYAGATMVRQPSDNTHIALEQRHQVKAKTGRRVEARRLPVLDLAIRRAQRVRRPRGDQTQDDVRTSLYRKTGDWYHYLTKFPGALLDSDGYVIFETEAAFKAQLLTGKDPTRNGGWAFASQGIKAGAFQRLCGQNTVRIQNHGDGLPGYAAVSDLTTETLTR